MNILHLAPSHEVRMIIVTRLQAIRQVVRAAYYACEDSCDDGGETISIPRQQFDALGSALDEIDALMPDEAQPALPPVLVSLVIETLTDEAASQPREATEAMLRAYAPHSTEHDDLLRAIWRTMSAALHDTAPTDQAQRGGEVERMHVLREIVAYYSDCEQGPGHCHDVPGIWDRDNPPGKAGTSCSWCATWRSARHLISTPDMPKGGEQ